MSGIVKRWLNSIGAAGGDTIPDGVIGQQISSAVAFASRVAMTSGAETNLTNITLTSGKWLLETWAVFYPTGGAAITGGAIAGQAAAIGSGSSAKAIPPHNSGLAYHRASQVKTIETGGVTLNHFSMTVFAAGTVEVFGGMKATRIR